MTKNLQGNQPTTVGQQSQILPPGTIFKDAAYFLTLKMSGGVHLLLKQEKVNYQDDEGNAIERPETTTVNNLRAIVEQHLINMGVAEGEIVSHGEFYPDNWWPDYDQVPKIIQYIIPAKCFFFEIRHAFYKQSVEEQNMQEDWQKLAHRVGILGLMIEKGLKDPYELILGEELSDEEKILLIRSNCVPIPADERLGEFVSLGVVSEELNSKWNPQMSAHDIHPPKKEITGKGGVVAQAAKANLHAV